MKNESTAFDKLQFSGLNEKEIMALYDMGTTKTLQPGEFLVRQGEPDPSIYLITAGQLNVLARPQGTETDITYASFKAGSWLGEKPETDRKQSPYSYYAPVQTTVLAVNRAAFALMETRTKLFLANALDKYAAGMMAQLADTAGLLAREMSDLSSLAARPYDEAARDYSKIEFIQELLDVLPRLPLFVDKLTTMLMSDKVSTTEVVEYAKTDPSVVSTTLRRINSPFYNIPEKITDFHHAVMLLGFNQIYQIALEECVFETFPKGFRTAEFHTHSLLISLTGFELATLAGAKAPAAVSTVGLIHDIGQVLLLLLMSKHRPYASLITRLNGYEVAALLFEKWSFPASICGTVRYHPYATFSPPERIPEEFRENVAILHIAHLMVDYIQSEEGKEPTSTFMDEYMTFLGIGGRSFKDVAEKAVYPALLRKINFLPQDIRRLVEQGLNR